VSRLRQEPTVARADLAICVDVTTPPEPSVATAAAALAPDVATASGLADDPPVDAVEPDLRPVVDVVADALAEPPVGVRSRGIRLEPARFAAVPLLASEVRAPRARVDEPPVRRGDPAALATLERAPTSPSAVPKAELQTMLLALYKASGAASPRDLALVGIYRRVPGGAIREVAMDGDRVQLRVDRRRRARAATLVVGRTQADGRLITAEIQTS
jgi:hypothetical protein